MTSYKVLLFILSLLFVAKAYECNHDHEHHPEPEDHDVEEDMSIFYDQGRMLASSPQIRMVAFYDELKSAPSAFRAYIQNELAPPVIAWFEGALRVRIPVTGKLKVNSGSVCGVSTPSALRKGVDADYAIIFDSNSQSNSVSATSRACTTASGSKRPLVATALFNRNQVEVARGNVLLHEKNMYLLIHEMMHTLGVSDNHYKNFIDLNGNRLKNHIKKAKINGKTHMVIDVKPLTQRLRNHFGCSSLPGAYMENNGGDGTSGSHFERKLFLYDSMCSGGMYGRRVSEFSLALLEGSGWYTPNYDYAEPFFFGKGQGCGFISATSNTASKYDEFCSGSTRKCDSTGIGGGRCVSDSKSDGMKYIEADEDYMCDNKNGDDYARLPNLQTYGRGAGSKCFTGTLNSKRSNSPTTFCFKYSCSGSGSNTELTLQVGNKNVVCDREGQKTVDGYYGAINCPDPLSWCNTVGQRYCPRNCMNRGSCINNKCVCRSGYSGVDCSESN